MSKSKLMVILLDALCAQDLSIIETLPNMGAILKRGAVIHHVEPIYPSFTYPCHCAIITGHTVKGHGIPHNEKVQVEVYDAPWYNQRSDIKCDTIFDYARRAGLKTCSLNWPVSAGADIDYNMPMIVPLHYKGDDPYQFLVGNATQELLDRYYWKYGRFMKSRRGSLDEFTMALAPDIIQDFGQPDMMFVKLCDLDTVRHNYGVSGSHVEQQLRAHDEEVAVIVEAVKRFGDYENTNFVILGDHGQQDIKHTMNFNMLLRDRGFLKTDENYQLIDYDAYCYSVSLSAWITLKHPEDKAMKKKVYDFLCEIRDDPAYPIGYVFTKEEAEEKFGLVGPFDFVIEGGDEPINFSSTLKGEDIFKVYFGPGCYQSKASHGHLPFKDETTTFFAEGPAINPGAVIERTSMVNEAPTMAAMLGMKMENTEGHILQDILR